MIAMLVLILSGFQVPTCHEIDPTNRTFVVGDVVLAPGNILNAEGGTVKGTVTKLAENDIIEVRRDNECALEALVDELSRAYMNRNKKEIRRLRAALRSYNPLCATSGVPLTEVDVCKFRSSVGYSPTQLQLLRQRSLAR